VEPLKFAGAQQVMEAVLAGRADGTANGTGSANIAIGERACDLMFCIDQKKRAQLTRLAEFFHGFRKRGLVRNGVQVLVRMHLACKLGKKVQSNIRLH
jgi:hypothetical protein